MVIATQNPVEHHGTYPLPESQLDRFLMRLRIGYPDARQRARDPAQPGRAPSTPASRRCSTAEDVLELQDARPPASRVDDALVDYMLAIVERTRTHEALALGVSPRGSQALFRAAQALALLEGRDYAIPDDVKRLAVPRVRPPRGDQHAASRSRSARRSRRAHPRRNPHARSKFPCRHCLDMKTAIIGLPMTGKTSLFTILTGVHEAARIGAWPPASAWPRCRTPRLDALAELFEPPKVTHATVEYLDIPVHLEGERCATRSYLASLRVVDAFAHVVRLFEDETVPHEKGSVDPLRDIDDVEMELDPQRPGGGREAPGAPGKGPQEDQGPGTRPRVRAAREVQGACSRPTSPLREMTLDADDEKRIRGFQFLSQKPMLYVLNLGEADAPRLHEIEARVPRRPARAGAPTRPSPPSAARSKPNSPNCPRRGSRRISGQLRPEGIRPRAPDLGHLRAARADELS